MDHGPGPSVAIRGGHKKRKLRTNFGTCLSRQGEAKEDLFRRSQPCVGCGAQLSASGGSSVVGCCPALSRRFSRLSIFLMLSATGRSSGIVPPSS